MAQSKWHPDELRKLSPGQRIWGNNVGYYRHKSGDGGGTWMIRYTVIMPDGSTYRVPPEKLDGCLNRTEALKALELRKSDAARGVWKPLKSPTTTTTFASFAEDEFPEHVKAHLRPSTLESYVADIKLHLVPYFGRTLSLGAITAKQCKAFYKKRLSEVAPATALNELACLRAIFSEALQLELVAANPALGIKQVAPNNARIRRVTNDEVDALFRAAEHPDTHPDGRLLHWLLFWTGMRIGEAASLERVNIDLEHAIIDLPKTKTGRPRAVPILAELHPVLRARFNASAGRYIFPGDEPDTHTKKDTLRKRWAKLVRRAGITNFVPHDYRHHFAKRLIGRGLEPRIVMRVLGWTSWQMLQRYVLASDDEVREAIGKLAIRDPELILVRGNASLGVSMETESAAEIARDIKQHGTKRH